MHLTQEAAAPCRSAVFPCHSQVLWCPVQAAASQVTTQGTVTIVNNITSSLQVFWAERVSGHLLAAQEASLLTVSDWQGDKYLDTTLLQMTKDLYFRLTITWMQMYDLVCIFAWSGYKYIDIRYVPLNYCPIHFTLLLKWRQLCELPNFIYKFSVLDIRFITNINKY